jgi:hypothetical protein
VRQETSALSMDKCCNGFPRNRNHGLRERKRGKDQATSRERQHDGRARKICIVKRVNDEKNSVITGLDVDDFTHSALEVAVVKNAVFYRYQPRDLRPLLRHDKSKWSKTKRRKREPFTGGIDS